MRWSVGVATTVVGLLALPAGPASTHARTLIVDDDGVQCPNANSLSIQPAINAARPGDTVRVCGGAYTGDLTIDKAIGLVAQTPAAPTVDCVAGGSPGTGTTIFTGAISLTGTGAKVDGFVVTGAPTGITTSERSSEYQIRRNLIEGNSDFGIELQSNGAQQTVVEQNCVRSNGGGGIASEGGKLRRAVIRSNTVADTFEAITTLGPHPRYDISISRNTIRRANDGIAVSGTVGSDITGNDIDLTNPPDAVLGAGVGVGGGNIGLTITSNTISAVFGTAVYFQREGFLAVDTGANIGILLARNTLHDNLGSGVRVEIPAAGRPANLTSSLLFRNTADSNGVNGFAVTAGNDGNVLLDNRSTNNGRYGIALLGADNAVVAANTMKGNGRADAHDDAVGQNRWIGNVCGTDEPVGALCNTPAAATATTAQSATTTVPAPPKVGQSRWPCLRVPVWDVDPLDGGGWVWITVLAPDAPAGTYCGA